ncbi:MAG: glycosyltransferase [Deferribacteres bacterium]|nr:glycosyltransferase [Deferribacteres bacterium]
MNKTGTTGIQLVITVALKKEIPKAWLTAGHVPVHTLAALKSGARPQDGRSGILVLITGAGLEAGREAARWIRGNLNPLYVLNIGTCGLLNRGYPAGKWIMPRYVVNEEGKRLELDTRLPVPYPAGMINVHSLISVGKAAPGRVPESWRACDSVDMECYPQAEIFRDTGISFHCLKFGTDYSGADAIAEFNRNLGLFREEFMRLFHFINKGRPEITAVVPVFNRAQTVKRAVDSILSQSYMPVEIIAVDDCSTDGTREILEGYGDRITRIYLSRNSGPSAARNRGIENARTEWIAFLDSDDCWERDKLEKQVEYLGQYPFYQILQSEEIWIRNGVRVNPRRYHRKAAGWIWEPSLLRCLVSPSAVLVKKDLLQQYGNFDETLPACEDYDLWLKILRRHPAGLEPSLSVIKYGGHGDQLSARYHAMDRFRVRSLAGLLDAESHPYYKQKIIDVLSGKLKILINGCDKRGKMEDAQRYRDILNSLDA